MLPVKTSRLLVAGIATLLLAPFAAHALTDTWDGGSPTSNLLTNDDNWVDNSAPVSDLVNTDLIFAGVTRVTPVVGATFGTRSITFNGTAGAFVISGQRLEIGPGGIVNNDTQTMTFNNLVRFVAGPASVVNASSGGLTFAGTVTVVADVLTVTGAGATSFAD